MSTPTIAPVVQIGAHQGAEKVDKCDEVSDHQFAKMLNDALHDVCTAAECGTLMIADYQGCVERKRVMFPTSKTTISAHTKAKSTLVYDEEFAKVLVREPASPILVVFGFHTFAIEQYVPGTANPDTFVPVTVKQLVQHYSWINKREQLFDLLAWMDGLTCPDDQDEPVLAVV